MFDFLVFGLLMVQRRNKMSRFPPSSVQKLLIITVFGVVVLIFFMVTVYDSVAFKNYSMPSALLAGFDLRRQRSNMEDGMSESFVDNHDATCRPRTSVHFLKTHKCASSTIQNIMMRFGERNRLNFVLGAGGNYIGSPHPFHRRMIAKDLWPRSGRFDIFTHHTRLDIEEARRALQPGAAFVTILRDPVTQFESMWDYLGLGARGQWNMTLQEFIHLPIEQKRALHRISNGRFGGNQMSFDLGFDPTVAVEPTLVDMMVKELDEAFDLVLIAEMMDESLVLLKRLMCWSTDDVIYLTKNARFDQFRTAMTTRDRERLEEYLALDVALYKHFGTKLVKQIEAAPVEEFIGETEALVARRNFFKQHCISEEVNGAKLGGQRHEINNKIMGYNIYDGAEWMCSRLAMAELGYTDLIRDQQRERLSVWRRVYEVLGKDKPALNITAR